MFSRTGRAFHRPLTRTFAWGWAWALLATLTATTGNAGSLSYCDGTAEPGAQTQDRLIRVASLVKAELERSGQTVALVARSGLSLQRLNQRYSHAGVSMRANTNAPWSVRQLYFACDEKRPRIFDQGMAGFVLGATDPNEGYVSIVLLPTEASEALERQALDNRLALQLLGPTYSANAHAFSVRYQNCNQWLAELLALAWGPTPNPEHKPRTYAQTWLLAQGYAPTVLNVGWRPLMWLAPHLPWVHTDDHPQSDLDQTRFRVSMPESIEAFARARYPEAQRIELCYTAHQVVLRRSWEPIASGCKAAPGDTVTAL